MLYDNYSITTTMSSTAQSAIVPVEHIYRAKIRLQGIAEVTPLQYSYGLSERFGCQLYLKREDQQVVRSYKIRGAYYMMSSIPKEQRQLGVVCSSAGNHAQGVALACQLLQMSGRIYMPSVTPQQKVGKVRLFGKSQVEVILTGDTYDDAFQAACEDAERSGATFVPPFDHERTIEGQGTVGLEILEAASHPIDLLLVPVGGGGLSAGVGSAFRHLSPQTRIIGVEPKGAPAMQRSLAEGRRVQLEYIDPFVDGAAVKQVGALTFAIAREVLDRLHLVDEGLVCSTMLQLYNDEGLVVEPAGALTLSALHDMQDEIRGKTVVCVVSGGNNDITRTEEIRERALLYEGRKHYFIIRFPQRAGALRDFLNAVLGPDDDITHFEYTKKHNRETGPALVGLQVQHASDYQRLLQRMQAQQIDFQPLNDSRMLFDLLV